MRRLKKIQLKLEKEVISNLTSENLTDLKGGTNVVTTTGTPASINMCGSGICAYVPTKVNCSAGCRSQQISACDNCTPTVQQTNAAYTCEIEVKPLTDNYLCNPIGASNPCREQ